MGKRRAFTLERTKRTGHLTESEIECFKAGLLAKRNKVVEVVSRIKHEVSAADSSDTGPMDAADMATNSNMIEHDCELMETERHVLGEIDNALVRIEEGTYGMCQACRRSISHRRLEAIPWARHCVSCAGKRERERTIYNNGDKSKMRFLTHVHTF